MVCRAVARPAACWPKAMRKSWETSEVLAVMLAANRCCCCCQRSISAPVVKRITTAASGGNKRRKTGFGEISMRRAERKAAATPISNTSIKPMGKAAFAAKSHFQSRASMSMPRTAIKAPVRGSTKGTIAETQVPQRSVMGPSTVAAPVSNTRRVPFDASS